MDSPYLCVHSKWIDWRAIVYFVHLFQVPNWLCAFLACDKQEICRYLYSLALDFEHGDFTDCICFHFTTTGVWTEDMWSRYKNRWKVSNLFGKRDFMQLQGGDKAKKAVSDEIFSSAWKGKFKLVENFLQRDQSNSNAKEWQFLSEQDRNEYKPLENIKSSANFVHMPGHCQMNHFIWRRHRILKLASNLGMCINFFVYCLIEKKDEMLCNFHTEITQPFINLEGALKCVSQQLRSNIKKNTMTKIIRYSTSISTLDALSKWHDPHIRNW